jgi:hypothetical protein
MLHWRTESSERPDRLAVRFLLQYFTDTNTHVQKYLCDVDTDGINDSSYGNTDNNTPLQKSVTIN